MDHEHVKYRNEELSRNKQGYLTQMTRGQIDLLRHSISLPKITALNIRVVEIAHADENHHHVYMSVLRETVAIVTFNFRDTEGSIVWQQSSIGNAYETGEHYSYVQKRIMNVAREAYLKDKTLYADRSNLNLVEEVVVAKPKVRKDVRFEKPSKNEYKLYVADEFVAKILFDEGTTVLVWQKSSKGKEEDTEKFFSKDVDQFVQIARQEYTAPQGPPRIRNLFRAYGGRINQIVQYEVTVSIGKTVIAVVQFGEGSLDGTIFWQKTGIDKNNNNTAQRFGAREAEIVEVATRYYVEKQPWPILNYRTTPFPAVPTIPKSES